MDMENSEAGGDASSSTRFETYLWSEELRRARPASLRMSLLVIQDAIDRIALPRDVVVLRS